LIVESLSIVDWRLMIEFSVQQVRIGSPINHQSRITNQQRINNQRSVNQRLID
jgi:hypothetical protein